MSADVAVFVVEAVLCVAGAVVAVAHRGPRTSAAAFFVVAIAVAGLVAGLGSLAAAAVLLVLGAGAAGLTLAAARAPAPPAGTRPRPRLGLASVVIAFSLFALLAAAIVATERAAAHAVGGVDAFLSLVLGRYAIGVAACVALVGAALLAVRARAELEEDEAA